MPFNRQARQQTANDLASVLGRLPRLIETRATAARQSLAEELSSAVSKALPAADTRINRVGNRVMLEVSDENLAARELGSVDEAPDQPITRVITGLTD